MPQVERRWLDTARSPEAAHWNLPSGLRVNGCRMPPDFREPRRGLDLRRRRYSAELRPYPGRPEREDLTLNLWIEMMS